MVTIWPVRSTRWLDDSIRIRFDDDADAGETSAQSFLLLLDYLPREIHRGGPHSLRDLGMARYLDHS
jgi:uncharacterized protein (DUF924 family)